LSIDEEVEGYSEELRSRESRELTSELSKFYHRLKNLEETKNPDDNELTLLRRKIGALEEEIGRRKKIDAWPW
jgi:hypothetical protein